MRRLLTAGKDIKGRNGRVREIMGFNLIDLETGVKLQFIQELIPLGIVHVGEVLEGEDKGHYWGRRQKKWNALPCNR